MAVRRIARQLDGQPQQAYQLRPEIRAAWLPSIYQNVLPSGAAAAATSSISVVPDQTQLTARLTNLANQRVTLGASAEDVLGTAATTIAMLRRCRDTTGRTATAFGYIDGTDRCLSHAPYSDGTIYWDYGDQTVGSGRITASYTKDTNWETLVFVAGPTKGREIWRRGVALARNASALAARGTTSVQFGIGASVGHATLTSDNVDVALFVTSAEEWSDGKIRAWCANPWAETFAPRSIWVPVGGGGGGTDGTANGTTLTATASIIDGAASGVRSPTAAGATLTATASLIDGAASAGTSGQADGAVLTATASLIDGSASAVRSPTVAGILLGALCSFIAGSAYVPGMGGGGRPRTGINLRIGLGL